MLQAGVDLVPSRKKLRARWRANMLRVVIRETDACGRDPIDVGRAHVIRVVLVDEAQIVASQIVGEYEEYRWFRLRGARYVEQDAKQD